MATKLAWRAMTPGDLDGVVAIASIGFPDHREDRDCFRSRLSVYPQGCCVLADDAEAKGYLISYPWLADAAPALNRSIEALPAGASVLYLHDLALLPEARGFGWSRSAMEGVLDLAKREGWPTITLVAVNDAVRFWAGYGFKVRNAPDMATKMASYGKDARYMVRSLVG